jgi:bifunctional enzyme CysN/CysC
MAVEGVVATPSDQLLDDRENADLLRFVVCGGVAVGKSTLIERLLWRSPVVHEYPAGPRDAGYRFFSTERRSFIAAEAPGDEQYTSEMVCGASTASIALILIDARKGVLTQTRRHSYIASLLGIRKFVVAINKLDVVGYSRDVFEAIEQSYREFAVQIGVADMTFVPISALEGDNIAAPSAHTRWYGGPTLIACLDSVEVEEKTRNRPFRMLVQWVGRGSAAFRGLSGRIVGGAVRPGDAVRILPSGKAGTVTRIVTRGQDLDEAVSGQSITITLADGIDVSRGDILADAASPAGIADQFQATLFWLHERPMLPGRSYLMKIGARTVGATIATPKYRINVDSMERLQAKTLQSSEIGVCNLGLDQVIAFDPYVENPDTGGFIIIDRLTNDTMGVGLLHFALRRSQNIHWQAVDVDKQARALLNAHRSCIVWFTGLSGAGKSSIANLVERKLHAMGRHTYLLDGDNVRHGLNKDLGFTDADRVENIRRVAEVARLMVDAGLIVLVSFISPFAAERRAARALVGDGEFYEIFVDAPLAVAEQRDTKGLYRKARRGEIRNFTGIDSPYERPQNPELAIDTTTCSADGAAERIVAMLRSSGVLDCEPQGVRIGRQ